MKRATIEAALQQPAVLCNCANEIAVAATAQTLLGEDLPARARNPIVNYIEKPPAATTSLIE